MDPHRLPQVQAATCSPRWNRYCIFPLSPKCVEGLKPGVKTEGKKERGKKKKEGPPGDDLHTFA